MEESSLFKTVDRGGSKAVYEETNFMVIVCQMELAVDCYTLMTGFIYVTIFGWCMTFFLLKLPYKMQFILIPAKIR